MIRLALIIIGGVLACGPLGGAVARADTVVSNVRGYTFANDSFTQFSYLLFDDRGKVLRTGTGTPPKATVQVDGGGAVLLPGLIDAHGHVFGYGNAMGEVDLVGTRSVEDALARVRKYATDNPRAKWILGRGWNQEMWFPAEFPKASDLDAVIGDRPVLLRRVDGHASWANTRALELAGVASRTLSPAGGDIHVDDNGKPTGILIDAAMDLVGQHVPAPDLAATMLGLSRGMQKLASLGLTAVHDAGIDVQQIEAYRTLHTLDALPIRIYAMLGGIETLRAFGPPQAMNDDRLLLRSVKLYSDGALGSRGAALLAPYSDQRDSLGLLFVEHDELTALIREARGAGYQVNVHAIGDRANRVLLDAFETAGAKPAERHRNEHTQIVDPVDIPRFKSIGIVPSMQPTHATSDKNMAEKRLGRARLAGAYAWRSFLDQGSRIPAGSDFPVEDANPFWGWYAAVTRQDLDGDPPGGWLPEQKMTRVEAFRAFTLDAAWAAHMDNRTGSLEKGKWADFILLDADPFEVSEREIANIGVLQTWVAGRRVWRKPQP